MSKKDKINQSKAIIRSSSAEYLTFIAATGEGGVDAIYADENVWLSQKMMGSLYNVAKQIMNKFIEATDRKVLQNAGKVSAEIAKAHAESDFDREMEKIINKKKNS